jgi:hypothetical protein
MEQIKKKFITVKTTPEVLMLLRVICAKSGEKQYEALLRILKNECQ